MANMKNELMDAVANNMALISNHMNGDAGAFIARETECLMDDLHEIMQKFAVIKATLNAAEGSEDLYEKICYNNVYGENFEDWWNIFEKLEDIVD